MNRKVYQSQIYFGEGNTYLVRGIVDDNYYPVMVITGYKISKISKYWSARS